LGNGNILHHFIILKYKFLEKKKYTIIDF